MGLKMLAESDIQGTGSGLVPLQSCELSVGLFADLAEVREIAKGLSAIAPTKVIWKLAESDLQDTGNGSFPVGGNVKIVNWAPQNDVLGHPDVKAFFTQGGTNSFNEVGCCFVPAAASYLAQQQTMNRGEQCGSNDMANWK